MARVTSPRTILIHEYVSGGGLAGQALPASWLAEGNSMRLALAADFAAVPGMHVIITRDNRLPEVPGRWRTECIGPGAELDTLDRLTAEADCTLVVAPETGDLLAKRARRLTRGWLGSTPDAIALTADKHALAQHLRGYRIPVPPGKCIAPAEGLPPDTAYPAVLKPIDGAGSVDTFLLHGPNDLPEEARSLPAMLLQPRVAGEPLSASFLVDGRGQAHVIAVGRQQIRISNGRFDYAGGILPIGDPPRLELVQQAVTAVSGLRGFVGVDFLWDSRSCILTVLEINPRVTTSYVGLAHLLGPGVLAAAWLAAMDAESGWQAMEIPNLLQDRAPIRFWPDGRIERLPASEGTLARVPQSNP